MKKIFYILILIFLGVSSVNLVLTFFIYKQIKSKEYVKSAKTTKEEIYDYMQEKQIQGKLLEETITLIENGPVLKLDREDVTLPDSELRPYEMLVDKLENWENLTEQERASFSIVIRSAFLNSFSDILQDIKNKTSFVETHRQFFIRFFSNNNFDDDSAEKFLQDFNNWNNFDEQEKEAKAEFIISEYIAFFLNVIGPYIDLKCIDSNKETFKTYFTQLVD